MKDGYVYKKEINKENYAKFNGTILSGESATPSMRINDISKLVSQMMKFGSNKYKLSPGARKILTSLAINDGVTLLELCGNVKLAPSTASVALHRMEYDGYVRRTIDADDRREMKVFITDEGRELEEKVRTGYAEIEERMMEGIEEREQEQLMKTLEKMLVNLLRAHGEM